MVAFAVLCIFLAIFMLIYGTLIILYGDKISMGIRIQQISEIHSGEQSSEDKEDSFSERLLKPLYFAFIALIVKATPSSNLLSFNKRLDKAGLIKNNNKDKWLYTKGMVTLLSPMVTAFLVYSIEPNLLKSLFISVLVMALASVTFNFYISRKIELRKENILRDLPYNLDLITVSVEAGLSFDGAMAREVSTVTGDLCDEFSKTLKEIKMGIQRKVALKNMSERCDCEELTLFINSIIQADDLGVSMGKVLRIEAANLREKRKQMAREKAMKAPVKMLFPLVFFIFPAIFIIVLGPAVISIIDTFVGGM